MLPRRTFLTHLISALTATTIVSIAVCDVHAKDDGGNGGSGHNGHDDDGGDDGGDDHGRGRNNGLSQDEALRELENGTIIPLQRALKIAGSKMAGKVIDVSLTRSFGRPQYRIKVRSRDGAISTIRIDARTGSFVGIFGF